MPSRRGPHLAWLWVGVAIAVLAASAVLTYLIINFRSLEAGDAPPESGPGVVTIELFRGRPYGVYVPVEGPAHTSATLACSLQAGGASRPLVLEDWDGGIDGPVRTEHDSTWEVVGRFSAPVAGFATIDCAATTPGLLVRPDDDAYAILAVVVIAGGVVGLAGTALAIVVGVLRGRRRQDWTAGPWGAYGPYPPSPPPYALAPYPPAGYPGGPPPDPNVVPPMRWPSDPDPR
jgi:hypothetical protein